MDEGDTKMYWERRHLPFHHRPSLLMWSHYHLERKTTNMVKAEEAHSLNEEKSASHIAWWQEKGEGTSDVQVFLPTHRSETQ
jgi:hypothetical protein